MNGKWTLAVVGTAIWEFPADTAVAPGPPGVMFFHAGEERRRSLNDVIGVLWAVAYVLVGGLCGCILVLAFAALLPRVLNRLTPGIDEAKEIVRGNRAVADYFGRIVAASILGMSIIVAAAVAAGIIAALH